MSSTALNIRGLIFFLRQCSQAVAAFRNIDQRYRHRRHIRFAACAIYCLNRVDRVEAFMTGVTQVISPLFSYFVVSLSFLPPRLFFFTFAVYHLHFLRRHSKEKHRCGTSPAERQAKVVFCYLFAKFSVDGTHCFLKIRCLSIPIMMLSSAGALVYHADVYPQRFANVFGVSILCRGTFFFLSCRDRQRR